MVNVLDDCCSISDLCPAHQDDAYQHLRGVAQARGWQWCGELLASGVRGTWPAASAKVDAIALQRVADLTRDEALRKRLARECERAARRRWGQHHSPASSTTI